MSKPSRQRRWQINQASLGLCQKCAKKSVNGGPYCKFHDAAHRATMLRIHRKKAGIPLDAPKYAYRNGKPTAKYLRHKETK